MKFKFTLNLCGQIVIWTAHHWKQIHTQIIQNAHPDGEKFLFPGRNHCILFVDLWVNLLYLDPKLSMTFIFLEG